MADRPTASHCVTCAVQPSDIPLPRSSTQCLRSLYLSIADTEADFQIVAVRPN